MSKIHVIENPSEIGAGTRGSSLSLGALKVAAYNSKSTFFNKYKSSKLDSYNHILLEEKSYSKAKRIEKVNEICSNVASEVSMVMGKNHFPFLISGDHSNAIGTIAGIKSVYPDKRLGVIWIDAHADLHTPYTTPSGNIHGMTLMASLSNDNYNRRIHELDHLTQQQWDKTKNIGELSPKIHTQDIVLLGLRSTETPEDYFIIENNINKISVEEVRRNGAEHTVTKILDYLSSCDLIYVSFDVDSMDCDLVSYGTGTPVANGFTEQEAASLINNFLVDKRTCCFEVVEINPCLDNKQNKMAETALRIIDHASSIIEKRG